MLLRELYEAEKSATLAFGRMNPPTIGHKKLVDVVASQPGDPFLFITHTQKPKTDPLDFQTKLKFAKRFFPNVTVGDSEVNTIIKALQKLESMGYTSVTYVAGSDRIEDFKNLILKYNGQEYNFNNIEVVSAGERDPDADGAEGMSASKMRAAAMSDDFDAFKQGVVDQSLANALYDAVRKGMGLTERELTKGEEKEKERIVKGMKKSKSSFKKRYGKDADAVMYATATKLAKEGQVNEFKITQQRPKIDVLTNIAVRKDQQPFPLSYKDTGDNTASTGGKLFVAPKDAARFVKFYDSRSDDEQEIMQRALKSLHTAQKLFHNLGIKAQVQESTFNEQKMECPPATQDLALNTKNRDATLKNFNYGPLNVSEPGDYWIKIAEYWKTTEKAARKSTCGVCVAFDVSPRMLECMPGETSDEDGVLGYCWMHHFKCHSARSCHTWAKGGPIVDDEKSYDWQERGEKNVKEGDLVLDRSALIAHLQREIEKFAREEDDVEKLSYILRQLSGQKVKTRNKKYFTVSDEDIKEGIRSAIKNLKGPGYYSLGKDNPDHKADDVDKLRKRLRKKK